MYNKHFQIDSSISKPFLFEMPAISPDNRKLLESGPLGCRLCIGSVSPMAPQRSNHREMIREHLGDGYHCITAGLEVGPHSNRNGALASDDASSTVDMASTTTVDITHGKCLGFRGRRANIFFYIVRVKSCLLLRILHSRSHTNIYTKTRLIW